MILAVVGSRSLKDSPEAKHIIEDFIDLMKPDMIVSGGAVGVDSIAEQVARDKKKLVEVFYPDWENEGKSAGFKRNTQIAMRADHILAVMQPGGSAGTKDTVSKAFKLGKPVTIYTVEPRAYSKPKDKELQETPG